jgi:cytochrome P450
MFRTECRFGTLLRTPLVTFTTANWPHQLNGDEWRRHRKIVAPVLNERIMREVWQESSVQAREMLDVLAGSSTSTEHHASRPRPREGETNGAIEGLRTIAINVIGSIGYGNRNSWAQASSQVDVPQGYKLSFMDTMMTIINNHIIAVFTPAKILSLAFMPQALRRLGSARTEFPKYVREFLMEERKSLDSTKRTLMGVLAQATDDQQCQNAGLSSPSALSLSEEEIIGNMFSFTIAGFDTTATTMAYALTTLALHPDWQDWIIQEIDQVHQRDPAADYEKSFPLLIRCVAFMVV